MTSEIIRLSSYPREHPAERVSDQEVRSGHRDPFLGSSRVALAKNVNVQEPRENLPRKGRGRQ